MIRELGGERCYLSIVSAGRPDAVKRMSELVGPATWYVPIKEHIEYGTKMREFNDASGLRIGSDTNVVEARNRAFRNAWTLNATCIQLDDDLRWAARVVEGKKVPLEIPVALGEILRRLKESQFRLAGVAPTDNPYFARGTEATNLFVNSGVFVVEKNDLWLDERLKVKFDYDYTLQHWVRYGGALRCDNLLFGFSRAAAGGHISPERAEQDAKAVQYLLAKWGDLVKIHPRRQNEILLNIPRPVRTELD